MDPRSLTALLLPLLFLAASPSGSPDKVPATAVDHVPLGKIRLYKKDRHFEVDGFFNLDQGIVEFLACGAGVKPHETLIALDIDPRNFNLALITLLGAKAAARPKNDYDLGAIPGDRIMIELRFQKPDEDGNMVVVTKRAEECLVNFLQGETMAPVGFVYTGSDFIPENPIDENPIDEPEDAATPGTPPDGGKPQDGGKETEPGQEPKPDTPKMIYAPLVLGQFISLVHRPFAILDNPLKLPYPDPEYGAYTDVLPRVRREPVPVTLIFRRPKKGEIDFSIKAMPFRTREELEKMEAGGDPDGGDPDGVDPDGVEPEEGDDDGHR